jgi:hypothetical protein
MVEDERRNPVSFFQLKDIAHWKKIETKCQAADVAQPKP